MSAATTFSLSDAALAERVSMIPEVRRAAAVEAALRVGFAVLDATAITVSSSAGALGATVQASVEGALASSLGPLSGQLSAVQTSLATMLRAGDKSQQRGVVGEQVVYEQLRRAFPLDVFTLTAATAHGADIAARVSCAGAGAGASDLQLDVRIEVKNYASRAVPAAEVDKFRRDVAASGAPLGLFVSLASGIAGVRGRVAVERVEGATLFLVPDAGADGVGSIWGLIALKSVATHAAICSNAGALDVDAALMAVLAGTDELLSLAREASALEDALAGAARTLDAARSVALAMRRRALSAERYLVAAARRAATRAPAGIAEIAAPPGGIAPPPAEIGGTAPAETAASSEDGEDAPFAEAAGATGAYAAELAAVAAECGATTRRDGERTIVERNGVMVACATGKRKLSVAFDLDAGSAASVEVGVEEVRGSALVVNGSASLPRWSAAVKRRLAPAPVAR